MAFTNACFYLVLFFLLAQFSSSFSSSSSSSSFISDDVFNSRGSSGRALLQATKPCSVNFEGQNYTMLTSQCKGPQYPKDQCCNAFKEFACPFRDAINDMTTNCATTMFSYINLYGKYPPGLFANMCVEGKEGLDCESVPPAAPKASSAHKPSAHPAALLMMIPAAFIVFFQLF